LVFSRRSGGSKPPPKIIFLGFVFGGGFNPRLLIFMIKPGISPVNRSV
jgi:hypothetical protein